MEQYHRLMDGFAVVSSIRSYKKVEDEIIQEARKSRFSQAKTLLGK